jgi:hypothetical protein
MLTAKCRGRLRDGRRGRLPLRRGPLGGGFSAGETQEREPPPPATTPVTAPRLETFFMSLPP